jgi:hypothetical protein
MTMFPGIIRPELYIWRGNVWSNMRHEKTPRKSYEQARYWVKTNGGPLTRFTLRFTVTSTRSAILMKGIPLFMP